MSLSLTILDTGEPALLIPDHKGEVWPYTWIVLLPAPASPAAARPWRVVLTKRCPQTGAPLQEYTATLPHAGPGTCECPDFKFRGFVKRGELECKHCAAARQLRALLASMGGQHDG